MQRVTSDRRIIKTRRLLQDAMVSLLLEKGYDAITVQDLLDRANVGRSTFYAHYRDKEALLLSGFDEMVAHFQASVVADPQAALSEESLKKVGLLVFQHALENQKVFKALFGGDANGIVLNHARKYFSQLVRSHLENVLVGRAPKIPLEVIVEFGMGALLSLLTWWLNQKTAYSAEQINQYYWGLVEPGVQMALTP
jgi:AcrR family transcriptional regulator